MLIVFDTPYLAHLAGLTPPDCAPPLESTWKREETLEKKTECSTMREGVTADRSDGKPRICETSIGPSKPYVPWEKEGKGGE